MFEKLRDIRFIDMIKRVMATSVHSRAGGYVGTLPCRARQNGLFSGLGRRRSGDGESWSRLYHFCFSGFWSIVEVHMKGLNSLVKGCNFRRIFQFFAGQQLSIPTPPPRGPEKTPFCRARNQATSAQGPTLGGPRKINESTIQHGNE